MAILCSNCGNSVSDDQVRIVPVPGQESVRVCAKCEPAIRAKADEMARKLAATQARAVRVARGDTVYQVLLTTCLPIATNIYCATMRAEGLVATADGLASYQMGFVDAVWNLVTGELQVATMEKKEPAESILTGEEHGPMEPKPISCPQQESDSRPVEGGG